MASEQSLRRQLPVRPAGDAAAGLAWLADKWDALINRPPYIGMRAASVLILLLGWELLVRLMDVKIVILPAPSLVIEALMAYAASGLLWQDLSGTLQRVLVGLAVGMLVGVILGLLMGWYPRARAALDPLIAMSFPIPKIALAPLFIIWFGIGDTFKIILIVLGVFYVALINTIAGVEGVPPVVVMASRNLGANDWQIFQKVVLPASLPVIMASLRISYSGALILVVAAEMIISTNGIGHTIAKAGELLQTERVFAGLIVSGILGVAGYWLIDVVEHRLIPWRNVRSGV